MIVMRCEQMFTFGWTKKWRVSVSDSGSIPLGTRLEPTEGNNFTVNSSGNVAGLLASREREPITPNPQFEPKPG